MSPRQTSGFYEEHLKAAQGGVSIASSPAGSARFLLLLLLFLLFLTASPLPPATAATQRWRAAANYCNRTQDLRHRQSRTRPRRRGQKKTERERETVRKDRQRVKSQERETYGLCVRTVNRAQTYSSHDAHFTSHTFPLTSLCLAWLFDFRVLSSACGCALRICLISLCRVDCGCCTSLSARAQTHAHAHSDHHKTRCSPQKASCKGGN